MRFLLIAGVLLIATGVAIATTYGDEFDQTIIALAKSEEVAARQILERSQ